MTTTEIAQTTATLSAEVRRTVDACTARAGIFAHGARNRAIDALWDHLVDWEALTTEATQTDVIDIAYGRATVAQANRWDRTLR
jgi:hypothetical protein